MNGNNGNESGNSWKQRLDSVKHIFRIAQAIIVPTFKVVRAIIFVLTWPFAKLGKLVAALFCHVWKLETGPIRKFAAIVVAACMVLIIAVVASLVIGWAGYQAYTFIDPQSFPTIDSKLAARLEQVGPDSPDHEKAAVLCYAIVNQMNRELGWPFGWTRNDVAGLQLLDNRSWREEGVRQATQLLTGFMFENVSTFGTAAEQSEDLRIASQQYFGYPPDKWGWLFFTDCESFYKDGIYHVEKYVSKLNGKQKGSGNIAVYNMLDRNLADMIALMISKHFLESARGKLIGDSNQMSWFALDDSIYYTQGMCLVVRDVLTVLVKMYPRMSKGDGENNVHEALRLLDEICAFDPILVTAGHGSRMWADHRAKLNRYVTAIIARSGELRLNILH